MSFEEQHREDEGNALVRFAVERRVTMSMVVVGVLVLGWISLTRLPLEYLPSFSSKNISVSIPYRSSSPSEIERLIVLPLEESLATINGIETLSSSSRTDSANINVSFLDGSDMDWAAVEVRDRIDRVRHLLPDDVEQVRIRRFQSTDIPVLRLQVSASWKAERLSHFAEEVLERRFERLQGVAAVNVGGLRTPELQINLLPDRLTAHRVDVRRLTSALRDNNLTLTAGDIKEGGRKWLVRAVGEFESPREIERLPITAEGLRLGDVAEVLYTFPRQWEYNFLNGVESLTVSITKDSTSNLLDVVNVVKREIEAINELPEAQGLTIRVYRDASRDVIQGLAQLRQTGLIGGSLAMLAVYFFLRRFRTTLLVALAIPVSVVATFVLLYLMRQAEISDVTINVISLAGLMLALGMLVDNSIVVIESIFRHRNELGKGSAAAALSGTTEVALPITASTITTICVFLPLIFLSDGGRFKLYLENIGITICIVIVASLLVALTVVPMVAAIVLRGQAPRPQRFSEWLLRTYRAALQGTLHHRLVFVVVILALLWGSWHLLGGIERSFASRSLEREVMVNIDTPRQYSFEQTQSLYREIYDTLHAERAALGIADITYSYNRGTGRSRGGFRGSRRMNVYLVDEDRSDLTTVEVRDRIRGLLPTRAGVNLRIASSRSRGGSSGIEVELTGDDAAVLELLANQVVAELERIPEIRDVDTSLESGDEEIQLRVQEEQALQAGLSAQAVARTVQNSLSSRATSYIKSDDREIDVIMQYREQDRETLAQLQNVPVFNGDTALPLGALTDFEFVPGPRSVERVNGQSKISISANTTNPRASFRAMSGVTRTMDGIAFPPGYGWSLGRWSRFQQQDQNTGLFALLFALPLVYMVLAALFESFAQPFTIMFSVPFALLGVGVVMRLAGQPWDNMTMIGLIVLIGVVVNNAIVLIDHINGLRRAGLSREEAILEGGQHRLRPILITAVTTILGMAPMVAPIVLPQWFGPLEGRASTWAPIGLVIVGGLTTSTFLTLMIIPTIYSIVDDFTRFMSRVARTVASSRGTKDMLRWTGGAVLLIAAIGFAGCGDGNEKAGGPGGGPQRGKRPGGSMGERPTAAVPVEIAAVARQAISTYIQTNGALEADNEVDIVARVSAPIVELLAEEGMSVRQGQLLARLDDAEIRAELEIARVSLREAELGFERAQRSKKDELISTEVYDQAASNLESARAQVVGNELRMSYTRIEAPFDGWIVNRYVDRAQHVASSTALFRLSDFDPLLCPVQVPERDLSKLSIGQRSYVEVDPWPGERFEARVLRIRPVVDPATGTIKVTLQVRGAGKLRPGMFARVYIETATRPDALVIPRSALTLDSISDTVYVADEGTASRREVELGYREGDFVEITRGLSESDNVIVVGQDGLSDGTPIQLLGKPDGAQTPPARPERGRGKRPDFASMTPEQLERAKGFMRERGMTDEEIDERIRKARREAGQAE